MRIRSEVVEVKPGLNAMLERVLCIGFNKRFRVKGPALDKRARN